MFTKVFLLTETDFRLLMSDLVEMYKEEEGISPEEFLESWFEEFCDAEGVDGMLIYFKSGMEEEVYSGKDFVELVDRYDYLEDFKEED
jgi:hypothetical protein